MLKVSSLLSRLTGELGTWFMKENNRQKENNVICRFINIYFLYITIIKIGKRLLATLLIYTKYEYKSAVSET